MNPAIDSGSKGSYKIGILVILVIGLGNFVSFLPALMEAQAPAEKPAQEAVKDKGDDEETPKKKIPRQRYIQTPGAPRTPIPELDPDVPELHFQGGREIDDRAKSLVFELTHENVRHELSKKVDEIINVELGRLKYDERKEFKRALIKYVPDVLGHARDVRINALHLVNQLHQGQDDVSDAIPLYLSILGDPSQLESVHYMALKGLIRAHRIDGGALFKVKQKSEAVATVLKLANNEDPQEIFLEQLAITLGTLGRPYSGKTPEKAEVGTYLANGALDPNNSLRLRCESAKALAKLDTKVLVRNRLQPIRGWNYDLQGLVLAKTLRDLLTAYQQANPLEKESFRSWTLNLITSMIVMFDQAEQAGNNAIDSLSEAVKSFDFDALTAWITKHQQLENLMLAERAEPLRFGER